MYIKQFKTVTCDQKIIFRLLKKNDKNILIDFFANLSNNLKKWYNPHPFNKKTAIEICNDVDGKHKKVIGIYNKKIISYCQLLFGLRKWEDIRFKKRGIFFNDKDVCTIAPCVIEDFQHKGLGLKMMEYVISICNKYNKKYIILQGGVVVKNKKAIGYYKKNNFKMTKKWLHPLVRVMSYDMFLEI